VQELPPDVALLYAVADNGDLFGTQPANCASWNVKPLEKKKRQNCSPLQSSRMQLSRLSRVFTLFARYSVVICLDLSPSLRSVDPTTGEFLYEQLQQVFARCVGDLVKDLILGDYLFRPQLFLTVVLHQHTQHSRVACHGVELTSDNSTEVVKLVQSVIDSLPNTPKTGAATLPANSSGSAIASGSTIGDNSSDLAALLEEGLYALKLLPADACPTLFLLTDGVCSLHEASLDAIAALICREDIRLNLVHVTGNSNSYLSSFGYLPDTGMMLHVAFGSRLRFLSQIFLSYFRSDVVAH
jgi:hypothetical protein